ncbi:MAG: DNA mismatch endonuclease Vsr [Bacilli bacterium]|nr:DNA mismatch endonuclease Vsr [Bacilli bacterium]
MREPKAKTPHVYSPRDPAVVSFTMSHIRGKETGIEVKLRNALRQRGFSYRKNSNRVYGHPDIVNIRERIAIFCDSEFWHGYHFEENEKNIHSHREYWIPKIKRNIERDQEVNEELKRQGYAVLRYWGFEIEKDLDRVVEEILSVHERRKAALALSAKGLVKTTLCYYEKDGRYLMLYRNKKENDLNQGKWLGVGGHLEDGESPLACVKREFFEETGMKLTKCLYRGYADFLNEFYEPERMYLFIAKEAVGEMKECNEGELHFIKKEEILDLNLWEGDRIFLPLLTQDERVFHLALYYRGDQLLEAIGPTYPEKKKPKKKRKKKKEAGR